MILSMTGYGRTEQIFEGKKISVEIKSLNGKGIDLNMRIPIRYKEKEFDIRKKLNDQINRGKVDCYINFETLNENTDVKINKQLIKSYMDQLKECAEDGPEFEYLKMAVRLPEAISTKPDELDEAEWQVLDHMIDETLAKFTDFRKTEGAVLQKELLSYIENIAKYATEVFPYEKERMQNVEERYRKTLKDFENVDETRFYQELAYYTEKLDISEEKVRLTQHLKYYLEVMQNETFNGKKLGFISQEIGREINTLGSKANHHEIQKLVVMMKDDLEKIKEQTLNVL